MDSFNLEAASAGFQIIVKRLNFQFSRLDDISGIDYGIGKPCECATDEHRTAQRHGQDAGEQCSFCVFAACHYYLSSFFHFLQ